MQCWANHYLIGRRGVKKKFSINNFKVDLVIDGWGISYKFAISRMALVSIDVQSTLVKIMVWSSHATSHFLDQRWPISMSRYGVKRPQWVSFSKWSQFLKMKWSLILMLLGVLCILITITNISVIHSLYNNNWCVHVSNHILSPITLLHLLGGNTVRDDTQSH